jgi:glycosyltransferase involved in cell wall biosynthesis
MLSSMPFTLTIITAVRNDQSGLTRTMHSVLSEVPFAEHLIIDGSDQKLLTLDQAPGIRVVVGRDRGISHAFNRGIFNATGDYIMFINAGDSLAEGAGVAIAGALEAPEADCHWFSVFRQGENGQLSVYKPRLRWLRYAMSAPHQGMMLKRDVMAEIGMFPLQRYSMDHHLSVRLLKRLPAYTIIVHPEVVAYYPVGGHSTQGGIKPFVTNCWNVARLDFWHFPLACVLNTYLAIKAMIATSAAQK